MSRLRKIKAAQREGDRPSPDAIAAKPSRLHQIKAAQRKEIEKTGIDPYTPAATEKPVDLSSLADYQAAMQIAKAKVSAEKTLEGKLRVKATLLPEFITFVHDYVKQGHDYPNDVAVEVMIWLLDTGQIEAGLELALVLVKQGQKMPHKFDRDMPTFLCDFFYDWAGVMLKEEQSVSPYLDILVATMDQDNWDVHALCKSKLYVMLAKHKELTGDYREALALCDKAEAINPEKAGVKGLKQRLQKKLQD